MYFALSPENALLSDLNEPLINFYKWLKSEPIKLHKMVSSWDRSKECYLVHRSEFCATGDDLENAARFFFLNNNCFNGIYRTNKKNNFNVPFSGSKMPSLPSVGEFEFFSARLKNARVEKLDFRDAISGVGQAPAFFYIDPPYFVDERRVFREYGPDYFSREDLHDLAKLLIKIDAAGSKFLLSYADSELARELFSRWQLSEFSLTRNVGGFSGSRKVDTELVFRNFT